MIIADFKSVEEINKAYEEHRRSLADSGIDCDEVSFMRAWLDAVHEFENK